MQLELEGKTVSIDAMGFQKAFARSIVEKKGVYIFSAVDPTTWATEYFGGIDIDIWIWSLII